VVQAALPVIGAIGSLAGGATSALSNQQKRSPERQPMPSVSTAMSLGKTPKESRAMAKAARDDQLIYLLSQPEIVGLLVTIAGIYASQNIKFTDNVVANEGMQSISTMASVLIGLGYAGVGDLTTLLAAAIAGGVSLTDAFANIGGDIADAVIPDIDWTDWIAKINPGTLLSDLLCRVT
jgi:hypothetical protein